MIIETVWNGNSVVADNEGFFSVYDAEGNQIEDLSYGEVAEIYELLEKDKNDGI